MPCGSPRRPGGCQAALAGLGWPGHGAAQPLAESPQSLSLTLSRRAGPSGTALSWIPLAAMFSNKRCCQTTVSGAMSPRSCRAPPSPVIGVGWRGGKIQVWGRGPSGGGGTAETRPRRKQAAERDGAGRSLHPYQGRGSCSARDGDCPGTFTRPRPRRGSGRSASPRGAPRSPFPPLTGFFLRRLWMRLTTRSV